MGIKDRYQLVIIGAGPAGLTASIYASRYKVDNLIIGEAIGGLIFETHKICNFPSEKEISGRQLVDKMQEHVEFLGSSILEDKVTAIEKENGHFRVSTQLGNDILAEAILLALGTEHRKLNLADEDKFLGKGISYCPTCDGMFYRDKTVAVVGGANSAHVSSLYLSGIAKKVYQIYRKGKLRGETTWINQVLENNKIEVIYERQLAKLKGKDKLEKIVLDKPYKGEKEIAVDGLFIEIGAAPQSALIKKLNLKTNEGGYINVNKDQSTSQKGIWAAGDITDASNEFRQVITAASEGAIAADSIFKYLQKKQDYKK